MCMANYRGVVPFLLFLAAAILPSCSKPQTYSDEYERIGKVGILYGQYVARHEGRGPSDLKQLMSFVKTMSSEQLEGFKIDSADLDKYMRSPRDGEPFVIRSGGEKQGKETPGFEGKGAVVVYEKVGDGKGNRYVVFSTTEVVEVDQATFVKLVPDAK